MKTQSDAQVAVFALHWRRLAWTTGPPPRSTRARPAGGSPGRVDLLLATGTPGGIRTHDLRFRKPTLYPAELRALLPVAYRRARIPSRRPAPTRVHHDPARGHPSRPRARGTHPGTPLRSRPRLAGAETTTVAPGRPSRRPGHRHGDGPPDRHHREHRRRLLRALLPHAARAAPTPRSGRLLGPCHARRRRDGPPRLGGGELEGEVRARTRPRPSAPPLGARRALILPPRALVRGTL